MEFGDAHVHLGVADHGEEAFGDYLGADTGVLEVELLLVDGGGGEAHCLDAVLEPLGRDVADIANLLG